MQKSDPPAARSPDQPAETGYGLAARAPPRPVCAPPTDIAATFTGLDAAHGCFAAAAAAAATWSGAALRPLTRVAAVAFDCDSTLSAIEGIDELAGPRRAGIERLTAAAMRGELPLEAVYGRRLALIRPDVSRIERLAREYVERLVPDAADVVSALHAEGIRVRIVSGGLLPAVLSVADALNIAHDDVAAVAIRFDSDGAYAGFDEASPLARSGGKCDVLAAWRGDERGDRTMLVGDGATDAEAAGVVDVFVAYAGVTERAAVLEAADAVIRSPSLAPVLPLALGGEAPRNATHRGLFDHGVSLLDARDRSRLGYLNL